MSTSARRMWRAGDPEPEGELAVRDFMGFEWRPSKPTKNTGRAWMTSETGVMPWRELVAKRGPVTEEEQ